MGSVGLLYVGAVLFINGLMLLGLVPGKAAAPMNFFVGIMQVVFPTILLIQAQGDPAAILAASGLYLFGFTYLYVGLNISFGLHGEGVGWFSLFVAAIAVVMGVLQFTVVADPVFGVIWFLWAVLWFLFFLLLGLRRESLTATTGWFTAIIAHLTGTIPALLLLMGEYRSTGTWATVLAVAGLVTLVLSFVLGRRGPLRTPAELQDNDPERTDPPGPVDVDHHGGRRRAAV